MPAPPHTTRPTAIRQESLVALSICANLWCRHPACSPGKSAHDALHLRADSGGLSPLDNRFGNVNGFLVLVLSSRFHFPGISSTHGIECQANNFTKV